MTSYAFSLINSPNLSSGNIWSSRRVSSQLWRTKCMKVSKLWLVSKRSALFKVCAMVIPYLWTLGIVHWESAHRRCVCAAWRIYSGEKRPSWFVSSHDRVPQRFWGFSMQSWSRTQRLKRKQSSMCTGFTKAISKTWAKDMMLSTKITRVVQCTHFLLGPWCFTMVWQGDILNSQWRQGLLVNADADIGKDRCQVICLAVSLYVLHSYSHRAIFQSYGTVGKHYVQ